MTEGQQKFLAFILENIEPENVLKARKLLDEAFQKQKEGTFDQAYLMAFIPKMLELIKPENIEKVKAVMMNHKPDKM